MSEESIKDLFIQKRYDEVVQSLEKIYIKLFKVMLDYKKDEVKEDYSNMDYDTIALLIPSYYPRYKQDILNLKHVEFMENYTYLDIINVMLSIYSYMQDTYKDDYSEGSYNVEYDESVLDDSVYDSDEEMLY